MSDFVTESYETPRASHDDMHIGKGKALGIIRWLTQPPDYPQ